MSLDLGEDLEIPFLPKRPMRLERFHRLSRAERQLLAALVHPMPRSERKADDADQQKGIVVTPLQATGARCASFACGHASLTGVEVWR